MKLLKRLLLVIVLVVALLLGALVAIPYLYKDELEVTVKQELNAMVDAKVDFEEVDLNVFKTFPKLQLQLKNYSVIGEFPFEGIPLVQGESIDLTLDLMSVISGTVKIESVHLEKPNVNIVVLKSGKANYDIAVPTDERIVETAEETDYSSLLIELEKYSINEASVIYNDKNSDTYMELEGVNHSGSGQFTIDIYDLTTTTTAQSLSVNQGGITYLNKANTKLDAIFNIDQPNNKYILKDNQLQINELKLNGDGYVQLLEEDIFMDLAISSPQNEFKHLLSMIPSAYIDGYEEVKADGSFDIKGIVRGTYSSEKEIYPAFQFNLGVENANIKYPDLPLGIDRIIAKVGINSPSSDFDDIVINVPQLRMQVGNNPFSASFRLEHPISDPDIDTKIDGTINLEELAQAFPMESIEALSGSIEADVEAKTRLSTIDKGDYDKVKMSGDIQVEDLVYESGDLPKIQIHQGDMEFTPKRVNIKSFDAQLGKSDIRGSGTIDNILAYFSPEKTMTGDLKVQSNYFNVDEWMESDADTSSFSDPTPESIDYEVFDRFDFKVDAKANKVDYTSYQLTEASAKGQLSPSRMRIDDFESKMGKSDLNGSGTITNVMNYVFDNETLGGNLKFRSAFLDLNQFITEESSPGGASSSDEMEAIFSSCKY